MNTKSLIRILGLVVALATSFPANAETVGRSRSTAAVRAYTPDPDLMTPGVASNLWAMGVPGESRIPSVWDLDHKYGNMGRSKGNDCLATYRTLQRDQSEFTPTQIPYGQMRIENAARQCDVSKAMIDRTLAVFLQNQTKIPNQRFLSVFDLSQPANKKRFAVVDLWKGTAKCYRAAHGAGSDPRHTNYATKFGNDPRGHSYKTSIGCAMTGEIIRAKVTPQEPRGRLALRMMGFSPGLNDNMCERSVYMHAAPYVDYQPGVKKSMKCYASAPGRSQGCPAFEYKQRDEIFEQIDGGGLVCSWNR
jgi:hypothetical protein